MRKGIQYSIFAAFIFLTLSLLPQPSYAATSCPVLDCPQVYCPAGYAKDANGCQTCTCNQEPVISPTKISPTKSVLSPTPPPGCFYKQVQCVQAPCNPLLVCPTATKGPSQAPLTCPLKPKGDANCDQAVDATDYVIWKTKYLGGTINPAYNPDFNKDGKVNLVDLEIWTRSIIVGIQPGSNGTPPVNSPTNGLPSTGLSPTGIQPTDVPDPTEVPLPSPTPTDPNVTLPPVSGQTYYIAPDGSDTNDGQSLNAPFKTFVYALEQLQAGDILYARGGTYAERVTGVSLNPGQSNARITVKAYPNEKPVVKGLFWMKTPVYWTFDGINVTWDDATGDGGEHMVKFSGGSNWIFTNAEVSNAHSYAGILVANSAIDWTISNSYIHDTADCRTQCKGSPHSSNQDHLFYIGDTVNRGVIEHNILANSPNGRGVKLGPPSGNGGPNNVTVRYNTMYNNLGPANVNLSYGTHDCKIYRNIMVKTQSDRYNNVNNNSLDSQGVNNIAYENVGWQSAGVVDADAVHLKDGGGNLFIDPQLDGSFRPGNNAAQAYGRFAQ